MAEQFLFVLIHALMTFLTLMITGRIFTYFSSETSATWQEDAQASALICGLVLIAKIASQFIPGLSVFVPLLYIGLIYFAFQLEGLWDIIMFYVLHTLVSTVFIWLGVGLLIAVPLEPSSMPMENMGGYGGLSGNP